jgi:hypothetical protein
MSGVALVRKLDEDFRRLESTFTVTFRSPEDARSLLLAFGGSYTSSLPEWAERCGPALVSIAEALTAAPPSSGGK